MAPNNNNQTEEAFCETKEYAWRENKSYVAGATCWSSNWLYNICKCTIIFSIEFTSNSHVQKMTFQKLKWWNNYNIDDDDNDDDNDDDKRHWPFA